MLDPTDVLDREIYFRTPVFNKSLQNYIATYGKNCIFYINPNSESRENSTPNIVKDDSTDITNNNYDDSYKFISSEIIDLNKLKTVGKFLSVDNIIYLNSPLKVSFSVNVSYNEKTREYTQFLRTKNGPVHLYKRYCTDKDIWTNWESIKMNLQDDLERRTNNYTLAYGKDQVGYDFNKLKKINAKLLADFGSYYVHELGAEDSVSFYLQVENTPVSRGDIISYKIQNRQIFYRITDKVTSFLDIIYKINCKLILTKQLEGGKKTYDIKHYLPDSYIIPKNGIVL